MFLVALFLSLPVPILALLPFDLEHEINCTEDTSGLLYITLLNGWDPTKVSLICSNRVFTFDMLADDVTVVPAMFNDWTNPDVVYSNDVCVLMETRQNAQKYRVHVEDAGEMVSDTYHYCNYSVGLDIPAFNYTIICPEEMNSTFPIHLENTGDVWLSVSIRCWNDWFSFNIAPGFTSLLQATFLTWTDRKKVYPPDTCVLFGWTARYQAAAFYGIESDWDYQRNIEGCPVSFGADEPLVNHTIQCPTAYDDPFSLQLVNTGDVWVFVNVSCWNGYFSYFIEPKSEISLPAAYVDLYNNSRVYPNATCVLSAWDDHVQDLQVYSEEPDWDNSLQTFTCPYSVGADVPALFNETRCPEDKSGPINMTLKNVGEVGLSVELWCWNDWYTYVIGPHESITIEGAFLEWTNPYRVYPENACIFNEFEYHYQAVEVYAEEPDLDYIYGYLGCELSTGNSTPLINHNTDCKANESGLFNINLVNAGDVWLYVDLWCWNDWFEYYIEPQTTLQVPAMFTDWTNPHLVFQEHVCALQDVDDHLQDFGVYSEESDWDYTFDYIACNYSVGSPSPSIKYTMECPKGNELFMVHVENTGDVWLLVELECVRETMSVYVGPRSNTSIESVFQHWTKPNENYSPNACAFRATPNFQQLRIHSLESDYDFRTDVLQCEFSSGNNIPAVNHSTDCILNDEGIFTLNLVNNGDVWLFIELHCWNELLTFNLEPNSTLTVPAVFNEWLNENQRYPENSCAFEDWERYQDLVIYSEEPDFDSTANTLTCPYSVGGDTPRVAHFSECTTDDPGIFNIILRNIGDVWVYVQLECWNGYKEFFMEPQSNLKVLGAHDVSQAIVDNVCVFTAGDPPFLGVYNEESDWDSSYFEILCSPEAQPPSDWETSHSWRSLTKKTSQTRPDF